jgi:predicted HNH restriction endonuclease
MEDPRQKAKAALVQKQGRRNDPEQLATICEDCHNKIHEEDREENE